MGTLRWLGWMFARLLALAVLLVSVWMLIINAIQLDYAGWVLVWILVSGIVGTGGGLLYLASIDGPKRYRTRAWRAIGWAGMLIAMLLPTSLSFFLLPLLATLIPTLAINPKNEAVTSS